MIIKACLFDLDGVIVDTAKYHFLAWKEMANQLGFDFTEKENEQLKGVSRMDSINLILGWGGIELTEAEKLKWATEKNEMYQAYLQKMDDKEILPGVLDFVKSLKAKGIKVALGSSSKNAVLALTKVGMLDYFEAIIDGTKTTRSKPDPQVFEMGAEALGVQPNECIVFEDAASGVEAALKGGFYAIGMGSPDNLGAAHLVLDSLAGVSIESIIEKIMAH
ncbi:MAG: beta-phosphoglucomutase [Bacteroidota bacterium]